MKWPRETIVLTCLVLVLTLMGVGRAPVAIALLVTSTPGPAQLYPSTVCGYVGNVVIVDGAGFTPSALVQVTWSGMGLGADPSPVQVDPAGRFTFRFVVPNDYPGPRQVRAWDGVREAQFTFMLGTDCPQPTATFTPSLPTPTFTLTPTATPPTPVAEDSRLFCEPGVVMPDDHVTVRGENFHPGGHFYQIRWDGVVIPWAPEGLTVGDDGRFTLWFAAPSDTYELHTLVADDGYGNTAACYVNLAPRNPTPTWTPTPTLTPSPTPTWTPGPPPGIAVTPPATPSPGEWCASIDAAFTRDPLANTDPAASTGRQVDAGIIVTNTDPAASTGNHVAWANGQVQVGVWKYNNLVESDTGARAPLPAMSPGDETSVHLVLQASDPGPTWFQVRLVDAASGLVLDCASEWFTLYVRNAEPYPPPLAEPPDAVWLNTRQVSLDWLPAGIPDGSWPVDDYEVHLVDLASGDPLHGGTTLLYQATGPYVTDWAHQLDADYGAGQLAWRARAHSAAGWGLWSTTFYFGVDTAAPQVTMSVNGLAGDDGWWRSPLTVRVGGSDVPPGSGLQATFLQVGDDRWQQVIPGGANDVDREGVYDLRAYGRDGALNRSPVVVQPVNIDVSPPAVDAVFSHEATSSGWYTTPITIGVEAEDILSGVAGRWVRPAGGAWQANVMNLTAEGEHTVELYARDVAGNDSEVRQTTARLDLTPPTGAIALNGSLCQICQPATASVGVGDEQSGVAQWTLGAGPPPEGAVLASGSDLARDVALDGGVLPTGALTLYLAVQDVAGWLTVEELPVVNAPYEAGPTPTPWIMATATAWPSPTPGSLPYATITPQVPEQDSDDDDDDDGGDGDGGPGNTDGGSSVGYPVGGTVVPAILPVTGAIGSGTLRVVLLATILLMSVAGAIVRDVRSPRGESGK